MFIIHRVQTSKVEILQPNHPGLSERIEIKTFGYYYWL